MAEYWDLYDENRNPLGRTIKRGDAFAEGEFYVCCEIWIQNSKGELLMTQRHPDKKAGGLWEFTGGGVLAGETTSQAAVRELKEELGICVEESELSLLAVYQQKNYFMDIFVLRKKLETVSQMKEEKQTVWSVGLRYEKYRAER